MPRRLWCSSRDTQRRGFLGFTTRDTDEGMAANSQTAAPNGDMQFHDAANIFPLDDEGLPALADDIREHGQQVEIELLDGKVLDGRRRWLAAKMAGKKPRTKTVTVADPVAYVLSLNLHRRHLSPTQLSMVAARAREIYDEQAQARMKSGKKNPMENLPQGSARDAVGKVVGVSGKSVDFASRVLNGGTPKLVAAVDADKLAVSTAARVAGMSAAEQDALADRAATATRRRRLTESDKDDDEQKSKRNGVGVVRANEAVNSLSRIPKNDPLRKRGFQIVTDWIRKNR